MKKQFFLLGLFLAMYSVLLADNCHCNHIITLKQSYVDGSKLNIQPGDTICIEAGERTSLKLINFKGSESNYIVFINCGGEVIIKNNTVTYGISITNSSFFRFTGTGNSDSKYGIKVLGTKSGASGLGVGDMSTNFEIDHIEIANTGFAGIFSKTDPVCDLSKNRGNFTQFQSIYHDNYIHNTAGEGMYIGYSFYSGKTFLCDSVSTVLYPCDLKGVRIYNNVIDSAGWDGIQVGCATEDCEIYNNTVTNYGVGGVPAQHTGIQIGGGTTGLCYNNKIINGSGDGIAVFGLGNNDIFNNLIVNAGYNFYPNDSTKRIYGIFCDDRDPIPGRYFNFYNNTIINSKSDGIRMMSVLSKNNLFYNNIIIHPGSLLSYTRIPKQSPYINIGSKAGVDAVLSNNYFDKDFSKILFVDSLHGDYRLSVNSPAIDSGFDLSSRALTFDIDGLPRPSGKAYDIGASEYQANKAIYISADVLNVDANDLDVEPGDTICLEASTKRYLRLVNFHGTADRYIVFKNYGGPVIVQSTDMYFGLKIGNSSFFRFTGSGTEGLKYGIKIMGTKTGATGLSVDDGSTNFEVDHIEVANIGSAGIVSRSNAACDLSTNRENFTQYQSVFHDNYIHNTQGEGMSIGHLNYLGLHTTCNNEPVVLMPSVLKGVRVYNNIIDSAYCDGIRVTSATEDCEIYANKVTNYGLINDIVPKSAIRLGAGTVAKLYNNYLLNGAGHGIVLNGLGASTVYNNVIVNAGITYFPADSTKKVYGILCEDMSTIEGQSFDFYNNTIVNTKTDGIRFASMLSKNNHFNNNIVIKPGSLLSYKKYYPNQNPYINVGTKTGIEAIISNNYFDDRLSNILFVDTLNHDYHLQYGSPAIDAGLNLYASGVCFDFDKNPRNVDALFDLGAYEVQQQQVSLNKANAKNSTELKVSKLKSDLNKEKIQVYLNSNSADIIIKNNDMTSNLHMTVYNLMGHVVYSQYNMSDNINLLNLKLSKGIYFVKVCNYKETITQKIMIK